MSDRADGGWKPQKFTPEQEALYKRTYGSLWRADERQPGREVVSLSSGSGLASGAKLSLRILRGKLLNTRSWADDVLPHQVECGSVHLGELARGRVHEIVQRTTADWPRQSTALATGFSTLARDWEEVAPDERRARLDALLAIVDALEAGLDR